MRRKIFYLTLAFVWTSFVVNAQISHGGMPAEIIQTKSAILEKDVITMPPFVQPTPEAIQEEIRSSKLRLMTFAKSFNVSLSPKNAGNWYNLPDGRRVWRLTIRSGKAKSLNVIFSKYHLPEGGMLFVYDAAKTTIRGGFSYLNNKQSGILPVMPVRGEELIIEYQEPANPAFEAEIEVGNVNHDYVGILDMKLGGFGDSESCQIDVACDSRVEYYKRGVVKMIINGHAWGSGALINTTANDGRPYVLSASHNFGGDANNAPSTLFVFNYEVPFCSTSTIEGTREQSVAGATTKAISPDGLNSEDIDFLLVELSVAPPEQYRPVYLGWNRAAVMPEKTTAIHHPQGDVKKVCIDVDEPGLATLTGVEISDGVFKDFYPNAHFWIKTWEDGSTDGGSSGCPLLNQDFQIVGALTAGAATCDFPENDFFYRLTKAWDSYPETDKQLKHWLDPNGTGESSVSAYEPEGVKASTVLGHIKNEDNISSVRLESGSGYQAGHNSLQIGAYAEKFSVTKKHELTGMYFVPAKGFYVHGGDLKMKVWNASGDVPGEMIYEQDVLVTEWNNRQSVTEDKIGDTGGFLIKSVYSNKVNYIAFLEDSIYVNGDFFIGFELGYPAVNTADTFALFQATFADATKNTAYFKNGDTWKPFTEYPEKPASTSLWLDVIAKAMNNVSTIDVEFAGKAFRMYPNPTKKGIVHIELDKPLEHTGDLKIFDATGRLLYNQQVLPHQMVIKPDLSALSKGIYMVVLGYGNHQNSQKLSIWE